MVITKSRLTAQGQISVPAEIRRKLGLAPGGVLEWREVDGEIVVRRAGRYTFEDIHAAAFPNGLPKGKPPVDVKQAIRTYMRRKHARG
jgi:AbrB family looped-hinge helix DNA binding protein